MSNTMPIRYGPKPTGQKLCYDIEQLSTGLFYDFSTSTFTATPTQPTAPLTEGSGRHIGGYTDNPIVSPAFANGDYTVGVYNQVLLAAGQQCLLDYLAATIFNGSSQTVLPATSFTFTATGNMTSSNSLLKPLA